MTNPEQHPNRDSSEDPLGAPVPETPGSGDTSVQRDPNDWVTGDEPMTAAQKSYLDTLAREAGEELSANMTKAEASEHIDRLQKGNPRTGAS